MNRSLFTILLAVEAITGVGAPGTATRSMAIEPVSQQAPDALGSETFELLRSFAAADSLDQWITANRGRLNNKVAERAYEISIDAVTANRPDIARVAAMMSSLIYLQTGERRSALVSALQQTHVEFLIAEKPEQYAGVRRTALDMQKRAEQLDDKNLTFNWAVLAADSSYFEGRPGPTDKMDDTKILVTLGDIDNALRFAAYSTSEGWMERFASLTAATIESMTGHFMSNQDQVDSISKEIAPRLEKAVAPAFEFKQHGDRKKSVEAAIQLAKFSYRYGDPDNASARLDIAEQRADQENNFDLSLAVISVHYDGERRRARRNILPRLRDAAWRIEKPLRERFKSTAGRIWVSHHEEELFGVMLNDQLAEASGSIEQRFDRIERLKARTLLDRLVMPQAMELETGQTRQLQQQVLGFDKPDTNNNDLSMAEARLISQLARMSQLDEGGPRLKALMQLEDSYRAANAGYGTAADPASLSVIQLALRPKEAIVEYVIPYHPLHPASDIWILFITDSDVKTAHVQMDKVLPILSFTGRLSVDGQAPLDASALGEVVLDTRIAIESANDRVAKDQLALLHKLLIQPLLDEGIRIEDFKQLVFVPHGPLHYVPFPALVDPTGTYLISKTSISVVPSASVWRILQGRVSNTDRFIAFGNPDTAASGTAGLRYAEQEVNEIVKNRVAASSEVYKGDRATKEQFFSEAPRASFMHFSTHGEFPDENALDLHSIRLADEKGKPVLLHAEEVRKANLSGMRLIVLSVCNGGLYRIGPSDEPYGLMPGFLEAGAHNIVGTLWPLDDLFGRDFMIEFYSHLNADSPSLTYQKTAKKFIDDGEAIRRWAGFILMGPGRSFN